MKAQRKNPLLERQLHAEVRRILLLLERTRRTRREARLLVARETGTSRRKIAIGSDSASRLPGYRSRA